MKPVLVIPMLVLSVHSCGPPAIDGGFESANPAAKIYAVEDAARRGDRSAIGKIIEQLHSDDPAVRLVAIASLKRLTGQTYGYRDFDPPDQRRAAIQRWVQAFQSGELNQSDGGADTDAAAAHSEQAPAPQADRGVNPDHG